MNLTDKWREQSGPATGRPPRSARLRLGAAVLWAAATIGAWGQAAAPTAPTALEIVTRNAVPSQYQDRDTSLYIPVVLLAEMVDAEDGSLAVVDVRRSSDFASRRLPGSTKRELGRLATLPDLQDQFLVLVDDGWGDAELERAARRLRNLGARSVYILEGGINAWMSAELPLEGNAVGGSSPSQITADEFLSVRQYRDWMVIQVGEPDSRQELIFPETIAAPVGVGLPDGSVKRVLAINSDGRGYKQHATELSSSLPWPVFYLQGGLDAMQRHLRRKARTLAASAGASTAGCKTCPK